jgi:prefoldin subunit 5
MKNIIEQQQPGKPAWVPPMPSSPSNRLDTHGKGKTPASSGSDKPSSPVAADDSGYTRFYNTFGSLINRISTPLAFAGLPLIQEESSLSQESVSPEVPSPKQQHRSRVPSHVSTDPDLSKIYSKATMRAIVNEGHGEGDSFYVVPTSGHTISYANILTYAEKEKRRLGASHHGSLEGEEDEDDFVDARETPAALSPGAKRRVGRARSEKELNNTIEELYTENKSLKVLLDKLTERLHTFEASAQNMAESYRLMRPGSPVSTTGGRSRESEEEFSALKKHIERLEKDNRKMQKTLEKYREKWETLKAGAKARREAQGVGDSVEEAGPS